MKREIIRSFSVWDGEFCSQVVLSAGIVLSDYRIVRGLTWPEEPYRVEFLSSGRRYSCPLHTFLPRTQCVPTGEVGSEQESAAHAIAV